MILRRPWHVLTGAVLLCLFALGAAWVGLELQVGRSKLVSSTERYSQLHTLYNQEFGDRDTVAVVIDNAHPGRAAAFTEALVKRLEDDREHVREIFYRIDTASLREKGLLYLPLQDLRRVAGQIEDHRDFLAELIRDPGLNTFFDGINRQMSHGLVAHFFTDFLTEERQAGPVDARLLMALLTQLQAAAEGGGPFVSPWRGWLTTAGGGVPSDALLRSSNGRFLFVLVTPKDSQQGFNPVGEAVQSIRRAVAQVSEQFPEVAAGVTGTDALEADEMVTVRGDVTRATFLSVVGVLLLFVVFWRGMRMPLFAMASLTAGVCWTLGFAALTIGRLNVLSATFVPILIGLGIDFNVHLLARYTEARRQGSPLEGALTQAMTKGGPVILTGALATAAAFFSLLLANFRGLVELGLITGGGILLCFGAAFTVLPALLVATGENGVRAWALHGRRDLSGVSRLLRRLDSHAGLVLLIGAFITIMALPTLARVRADFNLLNLQARGVESVKWELKVLQEAEMSSWFGVAFARTPGEVARKQAAFASLPTVGRVESVLSFIPDDQPAKLQVFAAIRPTIEALPPGFGAEGPVDLGRLMDTLGRIQFKLQGVREPALQQVRERIVRVLGIIGATDPTEVRGNLTAFQHALFTDLREQVQFLKRAVRAQAVTLDELPTALKSRYVGPSGHYLLKIYPEKNIWDQERLAAFTKAVRTVDADVSGDPIMTFEYGRAMARGYQKGGLYTLLAVLLISFLAFRRFFLVLLVITPLLVGVLWTIGMMVLLGIEFNLANLIIVPLILGIGIVNGLYIVGRYRQERRGGMAAVVNSTGRGVVLSSLTTMVGFGSLAIAQHHGVSSLGVLVSVGVGSVLVASLMVLPALLGFHARMALKACASEGSERSLVQAVTGDHPQKQ